MIATGKAALAAALDARVNALKAKPDEAIRKQFVVDSSAKAVNEETRTATFVITTGAVDRDNDTISPKGWMLDSYLKNPSVLWAHDYSQLPVGKAIDMVATEKGLTSTVQFPPKGVHPFADTVFELVKGGFLNATSVGFRPTEFERNEERGGLDFTKQELLEYSIVPVPANHEALIVARSKGIDTSLVEGWAKSVLFPAKDALAECPNCDMPYDGPNPMCDACMALQPGAGTGESTMPLATAPGIQTSALLRGTVKVGSMFAAPRSIEGMTEVCKGNDDPLRWNRTLSKTFDVAAEPADAHGAELAWVARYLGCKVQEISSEALYISSARMGSFLTALDERLADWTVDAVRNLGENGRELPPVYENLQLNSTTTRSFLVEGTRYLGHKGDGVKMAQKLEPTWSGLYLTHYVQHDRAPVREEFVRGVQTRAASINYLRGEAFTLSGEFLSRGDLNWDALFLDPKKEAPLRRAVERINEHGEDMPSRGLMLMGPPGTGKTLSGRVMMRQADTTFIWVSARDFYRAGAYGAFTQAFDIAAECAPSIIFFEDVDNWISGTSIDLLKTEMDGLKSRKGILTIMTTNFPELLPDALIDRPGRFHDLVELDVPDVAVRTRMLRAWLPELTQDAAAKVAELTDGYSGAHLWELTHFAQTIQREETATLADALQRAIDKIKEQRDLVAELHEGRSDYRPRREVRMAVAQAKALAAARTAQAAAPGDEAVLELTDDAVVVEIVDDVQDDKAIVFELVDDEETISAEDFRAALREAMPGALAAVVREQTQRALDRARGRVD